MGLKDQAIAEGGLPVPSGDGWEKHERGEQFTFDSVGDMIEGTLVGKEFTQINGKDVGRYTIRTATGDRIVIGSTVLDDLIKPIRGQTDIAIRFDGEEETRSGQSLRRFTIWTRPVAGKRA